MNTEKLNTIVGALNLHHGVNDISWKSNAIDSYRFLSGVDVFAEIDEELICVLTSALIEENLVYENILVSTNLEYNRFKEKLKSV